jgi:hypothetical protein
MAYPGGGPDSDRRADGTILKCRKSLFVKLDFQLAITGVAVEKVSGNQLIFMKSA